jgi:uncharacterized protein YhbP (UPF0306 family)
VTAVRRAGRRFASSRIEAAARALLDASTLCAVATVSRRGSAHVNAVYFAWDRELGVVWISAPEAQHSRNLRGNSSAAVTVFDSAQTWGGEDRGIQLFGSARELDGFRAAEAERVYAERFPGYRPGELGALRLYRFRPERIKVFDEETLGPGLFVTARVRGGGRLEWARTDVYDIRSDE